MRLVDPEDFEPWVGKKVRVNTIPEAVEVTLSRIEKRPASPGFDTRQPFSLFFESASDVYLLDATYAFDCGRGGPYDIMITQLQPGGDRRYYQAVFA